jgi:hypothetical protein
MPASPSSRPSPAPPACLDECTELDLVEALAVRGYDVTSIQVVGPRGVGDDLVLARTTELGRVLVTHNVRDFRVVDAAFRSAGRSHGGVIGVPQARGGPLSRVELRVAMMLDWLSTQAYESRLFRWGQLQQLLEQGFRLEGFSEEDIGHALGQR